MNQYLLFIDTEASGLPRKWNLPYSNNNNWPYSVQISWLVFNVEGEELKREDHYIGDPDFKISKASIKIHGITRELLNTKGENRKDVLQRLTADLEAYKPLVIGHFMELDYHVLAADFFRSGLDNPIAKLNLPAFCTMLSSEMYVQNPHRKFLKLGELYHTLFDRILLNPHNAIVDAKATADCFFEMFRRGDITENQIDVQKLDLRPKVDSGRKSGWFIFPFLLLLILIAILWI